VSEKIVGVSEGVSEGVRQCWHDGSERETVLSLLFICM
jgi:hypothetical protein